MRTLDLSPLFRSSIGFDHLESMLDSAVHGSKNQTSYPPYNIEVVSEDRYRITMAVAGFKQEEVDITSEQNTLTIIGEQQSDENVNYLHRGIAARNFERSFQLADYVKVIDASLQDGLLHIELQRELPETLKPRKIQINDHQSNIKSVTEQVA
ncbi:16 kDa heat shock protein A [hydrothermal vent metagenome]|uniref:16 kDa heat shock protein A n=1 Tax=hydrothermal vent metagenome TaxID=652676 RepID=A0A3B0Z1P0_9ZZZZ